jgi:hypothetical protein
MDNFFTRIIFEPFERLSERLLQFLPDALTAALILITGSVLALVLKVVLQRVFSAIKLDKLVERTGVGEALRKGGVKDPLSVMLSKTFSGLTVISFLFLAISSLNAPAIDLVLERFVLYLPNIFVAAFILFLGYLLGNFLGRTALIAAVNAGLKVSGLIGKLVKLTVVMLALTMALEQLGIGKETIVIAFALLFGGVVLALALAFGLGGKDIAKEYVEKKIKGEEKKDDIEHL